MRSPMELIMNEIIGMVLITILFIILFLPFILTSLPSKCPKCNSKKIEKINRFCDEKRCNNCGYEYV